MKSKHIAKRIEGLCHRKVEGEFLKPDYCRGRKDGRKSPDAWLASLEAVEADETNFREQASSTIKQTQAEANEHLSHIEQLLTENSKTQEKLEEEGHLLPEPTAYSLYKSAVRDLAIAILLALADLAAVIFIAKQIFGEQTLVVAPIGILLTGGCMFGIKTLLEHLTTERKAWMKRVITYSGVMLILIGLAGLTMLRSVTFDIALSGEGAMSVREVSIGNLTLMIGLGVGVPLILGVLWETEVEKLKVATTSLRVYSEESELLKAKTEWQSLVEKLKELDDSLDDVTEQIVKLRRNRYIRGFIRGVRGDPDKRRYVEEISNWTRQHGSFTSAEVLTWLKIMIYCQTSQKLKLGFLGLRQCIKSQIYIGDGLKTGGLPT